MSKPHTPASRAAAAATGLLAVLTLVRAVATGNALLAGTAAVVGLLTLGSAAALARDNSFEARLAAVALGAIQLLVALLAVTIGLPGEEPHPTDTMAMLTIAAGVVVIALIALDGHRRRRAAADPDAPPHYAR